MYGSLSIFHACFVFVFFFVLFFSLFAFLRINVSVIIIINDVVILSLYVVLVVQWLGVALVIERFDSRPGRSTRSTPPG